MNADERMLTKMMAAARTFEFDKDGENPPPCFRETTLAEALRRIAEGEINLNEIREFAVEALERWEEELPDPDALQQLARGDDD